MPERLIELAEALKTAFPEYTPPEAAEAAKNLLAYADLVNDAYDLLLADPDRYAEFRALTESLRGATVEAGQLEPANTHQSPSPRA
jgi:hypothetical protein